MSDIKFSDAICKNCGKELNLCEGDILQIIQEMLTCLEVKCENCNELNEVYISKSYFALESKLIEK